MADQTPETQHEITIGPSPLAAAKVQAALIAGDVESGQAQPPGPHVVYKDKDGKDQSLSPPQLNAKGEGNCASIPRAAAPFVNASHVGVAVVPQADGSTLHHTFLLGEARPGEAPVVTGPDGRAVTPIPPTRIVDPNVGHGMNGGKPLPAEVYQGAALAPIYPPGTPDLSHVHDDPAARAAEGNAHQGAERLHTPATPEGATVAQVSHLAARLVTPDPKHEPGPVEHLYPAHPVLDEVVTVEDAVEGALKRALPWRTTRQMAKEYGTGLDAIAKGVNPAPVSGDPPIGPEHVAAAKLLSDHAATLVAAQVPEHPEHAPAKAALANHVERLKTADRDDPAHDAHATAVAEIDAMLPGIVPDQVRRHLCRFDDDCDGGGDELLALDDDRGDDFALVVALPAVLEDALREVACGHPGDGRRRPRPAPSRKVDPRMGSVMAPAAPSGGGGKSSGSVKSVASSGALMSLASNASKGNTPPSSAPSTSGRPDSDDGWRDGGWRGRDAIVGEVDVATDLDEVDDDDDDDEVVVQQWDTPAPPPVVIQGPTRTQVVEVPGPTQFVSAPDPAVVVADRPQVVEEVPAWRRFGRDRDRPDWLRRGPVNEGWRGAGRGRGPYVGGGQYGRSATALGQKGFVKAGGATPALAAAAKNMATGSTTGCPPGSSPTGRGGACMTPDGKDVGIHGIGDWFRGWGRRDGDRVVVGDRYLDVGRPFALRQAIDAYAKVPWVRARLDAGGSYLGVTLADVQAMTAPMVDVPMGRTYNATGSIGGGGGGGRWRRGYGTPSWGSPQTIVVQPPPDDDPPPLVVYADRPLSGIGGRDGGGALDDEDDDAPAFQSQINCSRCAS